MRPKFTLKDGNEFREVPKESTKDCVKAGPVNF